MKIATVVALVVCSSAAWAKAATTGEGSVRFASGYGAAVAIPFADTPSPEQRPVPLPVAPEAAIVVAPPQSPDIAADLQPVSETDFTHLAAALGVLAGGLSMAALNRRRGRATPAPVREAHRLRSTCRPFMAAPLWCDFPMAGEGGTCAMIPLGGSAPSRLRQASIVEAGFGQGSVGRGALEPSRFGYSDFGACDSGRDGAVYGPYGNRDPVIVIYPVDTRGYRPAQMAAPELAARPDCVAASVQYRMFTLDAGTVRTCQPFTATDDRAALAQARRCEPTQAFELWRGRHLVTSQPPIH